MEKKIETIEDSADSPGTVTLTDTQKRFLEALRNALGIISKAAEEAGTSRQMHYNWMRGDCDPLTQALYVAEVEDIKEFSKDVIHSAILEKVQEGDGEMIRFAARCLLKDRGFGDIDHKELGVGTGGGNTFILQILPPSPTLLAKANPMIVLPTEPVPVENLQIESAE